MSEPGLHVLFDSGKDSPDRGVAEIDIVAVHGLNFKNDPDHARDTWKRDDSLWLKDFLPGKLAKPVRVMLFSYNSSPAIDAAAIKLDDHAKNLLQWLDIERQEPQRPLIFICHSLGGLVVKEALVEANLDVTYKPIVEATKLLVFFATPHRGGNYAGIGDVVARVVRFSLWNPSNKLLDDLKKNSDSATKRFEQSRHLYERCHVVNFFEGTPYGKLGIIVDKDSATLGLPGSREKQVAMHANHSSICKFGSVDTPICRLVLQTIAKEVDRALEIEPKNVHWLVSRPVNPIFTGRRKVIEKIKSAVISFTPGAQKRFILTGMGGQGKSEVCLKVSNELREEFWGVFWVDVSSDSTANAGFSTIAKMLGSKEAGLDEARRLLSSVDPKRHWLLVLDNADNPEVDYQQYCPSGTRGTVLITSRNPKCQMYETVGYEDLGNLNTEDCIRLLLRSMGLAPKSPEVNSDAERVIDILGSHTLAILQAGAYIAQGACSLSEYPGVFRRQRDRLLKFNLTQAQSRYSNVYATLEASAEVLDTMQSERAQDSLCLLEVLSPLHYENVPLDLFQNAWNGAQKVLNYPANDAIDDLTNWHVSQLPDFLESHSQTWDPFRMSEALNLLESLALIKRSNTDGCQAISMHPLAHSWINLRQNPTQRDDSLRKSQCIIALFRYYQPEWRPYRNRIGPHLLSLLERRSLTRGRMFDGSLPIHIQIGWLLDDIRYDKKLEEHLQYIFTKFGISRNNTSRKLLNLFELTSINAYRRGNIKRSIKILRQIVRIKKKKQNKTHPNLLASQHELARAYLANGQIKEAIDLFQHVVEIEETTLDETHPNLLISQNNLASAYLDDKQIKEAIDLFQHVVRLRETTLDKTHPDLLASQHGLAATYLANGQIKEAINLFQHVVKIEETTLDKTHPYLLTSQHELAATYLANGQIKEANDLFQHVVKIEETTLDKTHPYLLTSQHGLAATYLANGQIKEAINLLQQVVQIQETTLDKTHPYLLTSQHGLAVAYLNNGQIKEAIDLLQHVVRIDKTTLDKTHPDLLISQHNLASAYLDDEQIKEAIDLFQHVVEIEETTLDKTHPDLLNSRLWLADALQADSEMTGSPPTSGPHTSAPRLVPQKEKRQSRRRILVCGLRRIVDSFSG
ncbi:TPR-like protein [Hypoxylon fuscum]|nr:TPR-like protein [Hypoxylon fuscum]